MTYAERSCRRSRSPISRPRRNEIDDSRASGRNRDRRRERWCWSEDFAREQRGLSRNARRRPRRREQLFPSRSRRQRGEDNTLFSQKLLRDDGIARSQWRVGGRDTPRRSAGASPMSRRQDPRQPAGYGQPAVTLPTIRWGEVYPPRPKAPRRRFDAPRERTVRPHNSPKPNFAYRGDGGLPCSRTDQARGGMWRNLGPDSIATGLASLLRIKRLVADGKGWLQRTRRRPGQ